MTKINDACKLTKCLWKAVQESMHSHYSQHCTATWECWLQVASGFSSHLNIISCGLMVNECIKKMTTRDSGFWLLAWLVNDQVEVGPKDSAANNMPADQTGQRALFKYFPTNKDKSTSIVNLFAVKDGWMGASARVVRSSSVMSKCWCIGDGDRGRLCGWHHANDANDAWPARLNNFKWLIFAFINTQG